MVERRRSNQIVPVGGAGSVPRIQFSSGQARALQRFSENMTRLNEGFQAQADQEAEAQARDQGSLDGAAGNFELKSYGTIRGRAYNQAATQAFVSNLETNTLAAIGGFEAQYGNDPQALDQAISDYRKGAVEELKRINPGAAVLFDKQVGNRQIAAVERARDSRFKTMQSEAEASMIVNKQAIDADLRVSSEDLFSDNPKRSSAAVQNIASLRNQVMSVYNATDPNGRPLFTPEQRAKAMSDFNEQVFTKAAVSWFDQQDDKAQAYLDFVENGLPIEVEVFGGNTENFSGAVNSAISQASERHGVDGDVLANIAQIESSGNPNARNPRSSAGGLFQFIDGTAAQYGLRNRFDPFEASDAGARLLRDNTEALTQALGRPPTGGELYLAHQQGAGGAIALLTNPNAPAVSLVGGDAVRLNGGRAGITGQQFADQWINKYNRVAGSSETDTINIRDFLGESAMKSLASKMRSQITFQNQIEDRETRLEEADLEKQQELQHFNLVDRLTKSPNDLRLDGQEPVTQREITEAVANGDLSPSMGRSMLSSLQDVNSGRDDPDVEKDLIARMFRGEDVSEDIIRNKRSLTATTMRTLLSRNQELNSADSELGSDEKLFFQQLKDALTSDNLLGDIDDGAELRRFNAIAEYKKRVEEGESPEAVSRDILERSNRELNTGLKVKINQMLTPRFSVSAGNGMIDVNASAIALNEAFENKQISKSSLLRQITLLQEWEDAQRALERTSR